MIVCFNAVLWMKQISNEIITLFHPWLPSRGTYKTQVALRTRHSIWLVINDDCTCSFKILWNSIPFFCFFWFSLLPCLRGTHFPMIWKPGLELFYLFDCSWPELVGKNGDEAAAIIKSECEGCKVLIRPEVGRIFRLFIEAFSHDDGPSHWPCPCYRESG